AGAGEAHRHRRERAHSRAAVPVQQPARRPSPARRTGLVPDSGLLPAKPRGADRAKRRARLPLLFRRRPALFSDAARPSRSSRLGRTRRMSGSAPIAALPMYDFPEIAAANDALWAAIAAGLKARGVGAPARLTRGEDIAALWRDPGLVFGQTCGYP